MPDSPTAANALRIGESIAQRYQLEALLGADGPSASYRAKDLRLSRTVAIKLRQTMNIDARARAAFERSIATLSSLEHPNIAALLDHGEWRMGRYVVSEWLDGETLSSRLRQGPLGLEAALAIVRPLLAALASVHAAGLTHANLKPTNVLLQRRKHGHERVKLVDFGFAKSAGSESNPRRPAARSSGALRGSLAARFALQEQADDVDPGADVYAVGVLLSQMLTGRELSEAEYAAPMPTPAPSLDSGGEEAAAGASGDGSELSGVTPKLPEASSRDSLVHVPHLDLALLGLIRRALAEKPEERFADAAEMLCELIDALPRSLLTPPPPEGARSAPLTAIPALGPILEASFGPHAKDRRGAADGLAARRRTESGTFTLPPPPASQPPAGSAAEGGSTRPASEPPSERSAGFEVLASGAEAARSASIPALDPANLRRNPTLRGHAVSNELLPPPPAGASASVSVPLLTVQDLRAAAQGGELGPNAHEDEDLQAAIAYARGMTFDPRHRIPSGTAPITQLIVDALARVSDAWHGLARYIPLPLAAKVLGALAGVLILTYFVKSEAGRARWNANDGRRDESAALARRGRDGERRASPRRGESASSANPTAGVDPTLESSGPIAEPLDPAERGSTESPAPSAPSTPSTASDVAVSERGPRRLPARDPFTDPVPAPLHGLPALVAAGAELDDATLVRVRVYNRSHPADPRGHLLLARLYCRRMWRQDCVQEYSAGLRLDPSVRGAPEVLAQLIQLVAQGKVDEQAADLIERAYGNEALNAVADAAVNSRREDSAARLKALRDRLN